MSMLESLKSQFIIPVIRERESETLERICLALADGGLKILEVTVMSDAAFSVIKKLSSRGDLMIGAGTILTLDQAQRAVDHGAKFLISPGLNLEVVGFAQKHLMTVFPGVLTPTEIMQAQAAGCETLKIFPVSSVGGASYLSALKGPFPLLKWMPSGGISLENMNAYREAGAVCVGMGGKLLPADLIQRKDWAGLTKIAADHARVHSQAAGK